MHKYLTTFLTPLILEVQMHAPHFTESRPYALNPTFPFCDRLTPDFFNNHVLLKNENDAQEIQEICLREILISRKNIPVL